MKDLVINLKNDQMGFKGRVWQIFLKKINVDEFFIEDVLGTIWLREDELIVPQVHPNNLTVPQND